MEDSNEEKIRRQPLKATEGRDEEAYSEVWENVVCWGLMVVGRAACGNPMGFLMYDYPIETVEYIWMNIWCMLDWILSQSCRNTLPFHEKNETLLWLV